MPLWLKVGISFDIVRLTQEVEHIDALSTLLPGLYRQMADSMKISADALLPLREHLFAISRLSARINGLEEAVRTDEAKNEELRRARDVLQANILERRNLADQAYNDMETTKWRAIKKVNTFSCTFPEPFKHHCMHRLPTAC
jgi:hypothetical protein